MMSSDYLFSVSLKRWEETLIKTCGEDGEDIEARISVPAMPSPYVVAFCSLVVEKFIRLVAMY